ncbi:hypothetical protein Ct61P_15467 [Colletotrichum tofieldiae]|nr:hypothetical protein Ct61P_15467 [Colletotrichum tofieldiae]
MAHHLRQISIAFGAILVSLLLGRNYCATPEPAELSPFETSTDSICAVLLALRRINLEHPKNAPTPFGLLGLDPPPSPSLRPRTWRTWGRDCTPQYRRRC